MKKQNILSFVLVSFFMSVNAQLQFVNSNDKPISNVKIFSKEGTVLGNSDLNGELVLTKVNLSKNDSIEVYHDNYVSKKMIWEEITNKSKIYLEADITTKLEEIVLVGKKSEFLILKGYFVTYQIIDDIAVSFSDGIIEYDINLKKNKLINSRVIESRVFKNYKAINAFKKIKGNSASNILSTIPPFKFKEEVLLNEWGKFDISSEGIIKKNTKKIGRIETNNGSSEFTIVYNSPQNTKKVSLLGITSIIKNKTITEKFNAPSPDIEKITSLGKYYHSNITKKDVTINYKLIQDLHSAEKNYLSKEKFKKHSLETKKKPVSLYVGNSEISVIPEFINSMLNRDLKLVSNKR